MFIYSFPNLLVDVIKANRRYVSMATNGGITKPLQILVETVNCHNMTENVELRTFQTDSTENDIQEYHEIKQDTTLDDIETSFSSKQSSKPLNEYDFFTQYDLKTEPKKHLKKKKGRKKNTASNLMDLITSEIAATTPPITENIVTIVDNTRERQSSYLRYGSEVPRPLKKYKYFVRDAENGWSRKSQTVNISPIFPRVLENAATEDYSIPVEYVPASTFDDVIAKNTDKLKDVSIKFLDISIQNVIAKHHHSFSLEKLLCVKVLECYTEYDYIQTFIKDLARDIKINRDTKNNLKKDLIKVSPNKKDDIRFNNTVRKYTQNVIQLKEKYYDLHKRKKELAHNIITLWADIEMVREKRDCIETPYSLNLTKSVVDDEEFEKVWNETFNTEYSDKLDKLEYDYVTNYIEYKETKNELKGKLDKKASKPKLNIDEEEIKKEIEATVNSLVVKDEIQIHLTKDESILSDYRQLGVRFTKNKIYFLIYVDDVFVCESEHYFSNDMFSAEFTESFSVQILPNNETIRILLIENDNEVSRFSIILSEVKTNAHTEFSAENFIYEDVVEPNTKHVGSGFGIKEIAQANKVRLRSSNIFKDKLVTRFEVNLKVGWNDKLEQNQSEAIKSSMEVGAQIKRLMHGVEKPSLDVLMDVISKVYEKDITDERMIDTLRNLSKMEIVADDNFPLDENNPDFIRFKLLHLRNIGGFTNLDKKLVPLHGSQITTEQLNCLQKTNDREFDMDYLNDREMDMDPIELQRFIGAKYIQKLNKNMLRNLNEYLLQKTHKDVVKDFNFSLRSIFSNQSNVGSLSSASSSTKQKMLKESLAQEQEIHVTVMRAFNLFDRTSTVIEETPEDEDEKIAGFKVRPLRPFVRVNYRGVAAQTVTAIGCHPSWSHTVKLATKLEPLSILHINIYDEYKVQIMEDFSEEDQSNKTVHYRYYNKWLGSLQIPLYAVLTLGTMRGTFKITTPPLLFGYESLQTKSSTSLIPEITQLMKKDTAFITLEITTSLSHLGGLHGYSQPLPSSIEDDYLIKHLNNFVTEYTNEFPMRNISLTFIDSAGRNKCVTQYLQPIPLPERDFLPKNPRGDSAISKSSGFSKSSSSSGKRKENDVEGLNQEERESVYSARDGDNLSKMMSACMRYVSLIPGYEVTESHSVTLLGLELLKVLHGSPLDHTILLASYFLYLGIKCWVAIGLGLPRGLSSYVLIKYDLTTRRLVLENDQIFRSRGFLNKSDGYTWYVCDATTGERHELRDVGCPLKTVDYVFDNENIWVNVQMSQDCESMSFDFSRSSDWQPVFDKTVFVMKQPVVTDPGLYSPPPNVEGLKNTLENKIKSKVQKWRAHMKTIWNRYCSTLLREMLPQWEYWAFNPTSTKPAFSQKLKHLMVTYKIFGFPLNMAYTNTKSVISAVKSTALHVSDDPNVEFALAVEVFAYPNNVISIWVFLASITRI